MTPTPEPMSDAELIARLRVAWDGPTDYQIFETAATRLESLLAQLAEKEKEIERLKRQPAIEQLASLMMALEIKPGAAMLTPAAIGAIGAAIAAQAKRCATAESALAERDEQLRVLKDDNFKLAAGQCDGIVGDEGGTPYCRYKAMNSKLAVETITGSAAMLVRAQEAESSLRQSRAECERLRKDAERHNVARNCARLGQHGEWVILPDEPHAVYTMPRDYDAAIDAALSAAGGGKV